MPEWFQTFFNYAVIFYSAFLIASYIAMVLLAYKEHKKHRTYHYEKHVIDQMRTSPYTPGVSIVAPAYNEEKTIINNVNSLLSLDYPDYEVVIVNDGSKDDTLKLLIDNFQLVKVPYAYVEKIKTKPVKGVYMTTSDNPVFKRLTVVDKENGGTKADASNAGVNIVSNKYFVCTDVDCIIDKYALYRVAWPTMTSTRKVIAVSASMRMSNGCDVRNGQMIEPKPPHTPIPLFQDLEYARSYLVGKQALSAINAMQNVSGGFGFFDTEIVIKAGGYDGDSFAEDMDMLARMIRYMCDSGEDYRVVQIPEICCWTEGPGNVKVLSRQRTRWGRGLLQFFIVHRDMVFNRTYRQYGMVTLPYILIFEMLAPVIEFLGYISIIWLFLSGGINYHTVWLVFLALYSFAQMLTMIIISFDIYSDNSFKKRSSYRWFMLASLLEPIMYHPLNVFFSLRGYVKHLIGAQMVWGNMTRKGFQQPVPGTEGAEGATEGAEGSAPAEESAAEEISE